MGRLDDLKAWARHLKTELHALYLAGKDPRVPTPAKVLAVVVVAYAFSPIDLIPDPIPILGYLDDLVLVPLGIAIAVRMIPAPILEECRQEARTAATKPGPKGTAAAIAVVLIWLLLAALALHIIGRLT